MKIQEDKLKCMLAKQGITPQDVDKMLQICASKKGCKMTKHEMIKQILNILKIKDLKFGKDKWDIEKVIAPKYDYENRKFVDGLFGLETWWSWHGSIQKILQRLKELEGKLK